jgi:hypothetical protein
VNGAERRADNELRMAWLTVVAGRMFNIERAYREAPVLDAECIVNGLEYLNMGRVASQLLDLRDLLEVADREGWWDRAAA